MTKINLSFLTCLILISFFTVSCSITNESATQENLKGQSDVSSPEFNRIKSLAGRWTSTTSMFGKKDEQVFTEYTITAGGSAVLETIFPGTPYEMISLYYDNDDGKLSMTHYCIMKNRPHFTLVGSDKDEIKMDITKVEGLKSKDDASMGAITLRFIDNDHFSSTCGGSGKLETMNFTKVK